VAEGLEIVEAPVKTRRVPPGVVAMVGTPLAFIAAEAVVGEPIGEGTVTFRFNSGHEARLLGWPCSCRGTRCTPAEPTVLDGTRLLFLPAGFDLDALTPVDLP
jgi:hypothetical protein